MGLPRGGKGHDGGGGVGRFRPLLVAVVTARLYDAAAITIGGVEYTVSTQADADTLMGDHAPALVGRLMFGARRPRGHRRRRARCQTRVRKYGRPQARRDAAIAKACIGMVRRDFEERVAKAFRRGQPVFKPSPLLHALIGPGLSSVTKEAKPPPT